MSLSEESRSELVSNVSVCVAQTPVLVFVQVPLKESARS